MRRLIMLPLVLASAGCFPRSTLPEADRRQVARAFEGRRLFLKVAVHVAPFFGDASQLLASDQPLSELDLLQTGDGTPIAPPRAERILPPGTPLLVRDVELPTGWIIAKRVIMTPRYHPWVRLELAGETRHLIIVLPQNLETFEDVRAYVDRYLGPLDPTEALKELPDPQRQAVLRKELTEGMGPRTVEMSWGYPERRIIDRPSGAESWTWPGERRRASFQDERLVKWEGRTGG